MTDLPQRKNIRLQNYDYTFPGAYFITICTDQKRPIFGEIINGEMNFSFTGKIARDEWVRLPTRFPYLELGAYVIMPNHLHGIVWLKDHDQPQGRVVTEAFQHPVAGSIPTIVRSYKSAVTNGCGKSRYGDKLWQAGFYDSIIRSEEHLETVTRYILSNIENWETDGLYQN